MFALVSDMESYPQFVPLCTGLRVRRRDRRDDGVEIAVSEMEVGYRAIRERFTTRVVLDEAKNEINVEYIDGPFSYLRNRWRFREVGEKAADVEFFIDYEFRSRTLGVLMGAMFDSAFHKFSQAFEERADKIYSKGHGPRQIDGKTAPDGDEGQSGA